VAFSARSVLSVADIIYDPLIFDLINEPVIIVTIVLTQPLDRLVFRVRISQFDLANGRRGAPHWKYLFGITIWWMFICHTEHGHSIRSLAQYYGVHPSTVLRSVCKIEIERDDALIDCMVQKLRKYCSKPVYRRPKDRSMSFHNQNKTQILPCSSFTRVWQCCYIWRENK